MKISVYTILFHDLQFYEDIIKNIYNYVDEFIIIDGPYSYAIDTLKQLGLFYDNNNKPNEINNIIKKYPKVKYTYSIFENEEEKRKFGYNKCSNELILLIDTDEFFYINLIKLNDFVKNTNKFVGCFDIYNMCDTNINFNKLVQKYVLFKKKNISADDHLDYLWLVGCKQKNKVIDYMSFLPCGTIYHQTLNRNKFNNIIKFIFYILLYRKNNNNEFNILNNYNNEYLFSNFNNKEILNIFIHSEIDRINCPSINVLENNVLEKVNDKFVLSLNKYKNNWLQFKLLSEMKCLKNVSSYFRLDNSLNDINILFVNVHSVNIKLYNIYLNKKYEYCEYNFNDLIEDNIIITNKDDPGYFLIIRIDCFKTKNDMDLFKIKNIF